MEGGEKGADEEENEYITCKVGFKVQEKETIVMFKKGKIESPSLSRTDCCTT